MKKALFLVMAILLGHIAFATATLPGNWRWRNDDGNEATATWSAPESTPLTLSSLGSPIRLRMSVYSNSVTNSDLAVLQYTSDSSAAADPGNTGYNAVWVTIPTSGIGAAFTTSASSVISSSGTSPTTSQLDQSGTHTDPFAGGTLTTVVNGGTSSITAGYRYENEFTIKPTSRISNNTKYYFRIFAVGNAQTPATANYLNGFPYLVTSSNLVPSRPVPGGVSTGLKLWLKADKDVYASTNGTDSAWYDQSGGIFDVTQTSVGSQPTTITNGINFNPAINFNSKFMTKGGGVLSNTSYIGGSEFIVSTELTRTNNYSVNQPEANGSLSISAPVASGGDHFYYYYGPSVLDFSTGVAVGTTNLFGGVSTNTPSNQQRLSVNGAQIGSGTNSPNYSGNYTALGVGGAYNGGSLFVGNIGDVIIYGRGLTTGEEQRVNSYSAIKYGVTLAHNYLASDSTVLWNYTPNITYKNDIAGIGRDDLSALYQKQSQSTNFGRLQPIIALGSLAATNVLNTSTIATDKSFMLWGDDSAYASFGTPFVFGNLNNRVTRVWKIQETGTIGTVTVAIPGNFVNATVHPTLLVSNTSTFDGTATQLPMTIATVGGVAYYTASVNFTNGQYFTFGGYVVAPGGVVAALSFWASSDKAGIAEGSAMTTWPDLSLNDSTLSINNGAAFTLQPGDPAHNFNPWTTGYSSTNYFYGNNLGVGPFNVASYSPLTVFGVARPTSAGSGLITGIDPLTSNGVEPGFGINGGYPRMYSYYGGINSTASGTTMLVTPNKSSVFLYQPPYNITHTGTGNLIFGLDGNQTTVTGQNASSEIIGSYLHIGYEGNSFGAFPGDIQEVIWFKDTISVAKISKVQSYLAIKYGSTLTTAKATNYLNSAGTTIWTGSATYQHDVAGIGRDDASGLAQKQSNSVNAGLQPVIGLGSSLAATNLTNANSFSADQSFELWGNDSAAISLGTPYVFGNMNNRITRVWKVQETGTVGTVTVAFPKNSIGGIINPTLLVSNSTTFDGTATQLPMSTTTVGGVPYFTATVDFTSGQYFTLGGYVTSPGGVAGSLAWWFKGDAGVTLNAAGTSDTLWTDQSLSGLNLSQSVATSQPVNTNYQNFNKVMTFQYSPNNQSLNNATGYWKTSTGNTAYNVFATAKHTSGTGSVNALFNENTNLGDQEVFFEASGNNQMGFNGSNDIYGPFPAAASGVPQLISSRYNNVGSIKNLYLNTKLQVTGYTNRGGVATFNGASSNLTIGNNRNLSSWPYNGDIAEIFMYATDLTATQRQKVESYMAIKWGTTLDQTTAYNYLSSAGTTIFTGGTTNASYKNDVAGIGRDDASGLAQLQSQSVNAGLQPVIGLGTSLAATNAANVNTFSADQCFEMLGDDSASANFATPYVFGSLNNRITRVWKIQETGTVGMVTVAIPKLYAQSVTFPTLLVSTSSTFDGTATQIAMTSTTIVGVAYYVATVDFTTGQYFTFGGYVVAPGGIASGLQLWLKADALTGINGSPVPTWNSVTSAGLYSVTQATVAQQPTLATTGTALVNSNPSVVFTRSASQNLFNNTANVLGGVTSYHFIGIAKDMDPATQGAPNYGSGNLRSIMGNGTGANGDNPAMDFQKDGTSFNGWNAYSSATGEYGGGKATVYNGGGKGNGTQVLPNGNLGQLLNQQPQIFGLGYTFGASNKINSWVDGWKEQTNLLANATNTVGNYYSIGISGGTEYWNGAINEMIAYNRELTDLEMQKINTYSAIKYGVTLGQGNGSVGKDFGYNYISSAGTTLWDATANATYSNDIAVIGSDAASGLTQKQSQSVNSGLQPFIGLGSIAASNVANTNTFSADQSFMAWGDDSTSANFATPYIFNGLNYRVTRVWKVQETGTVGTVTVAIPATYINAISYPTLLVSNSSTFDGTATKVAMTSTTIGGVVYYVATIDFTSGQFFTFGGYAIAPGGVLTSLAFWSKSDAAGVAEGSAMTSWPDISPNDSAVYVHTGGAFTLQPGDAAHNFNPYATGFSATNYFQGFNYNVALNYYAVGTKPGIGAYVYSPLTVFGAARPTVAAQGAITGIGANVGQAPEPGFAFNGTYPSMYRAGNTINAAATGTKMQVTLNKSSVFLYQPPYNSANSGSGNLLFGLDGNQSVIAGQNAASSLGGPYLNIGYDSYTLGAFQGDIQEVIWYKDTISAAKISQVQSYLAIKYGSTLTTATATNYVNSAGSVIWTGNATYQHDVAGIGLDSASALVQKQSNSVNSGFQPIIGIGSSLAATNLTNTNVFSTDKSYLLWGDDSTATTFGTPYVFGGLNNRVTRVWKVQETGTIGTVTVAIPASYVNSTAKPTLLVSNTNTFDGTATQVAMTATTVGGVAYYAAPVNFTTGQYFSFGGYLVAPGGVASPLAWWFKGDAGVTLNTAGTSDTLWADQSQSGLNVSQATASQQPINLNYQNFNKVMTFTYGLTNQSMINTNGYWKASANNTAYNVFAVAKHTNGTGSVNSLFSESTSLGDQELLFDNGGNMQMGFNGSNDLYGIPFPTAARGVPQLIANRYNNVGSVKNFYLNNKLQTTVTNRGGVATFNGSGATGHPLGIGNNYNQSSWPFNGDIAEMFMYAGDLSTTQMQKVQSYMAIKWGTTLDQTTPYNYLSSAGATTWNATTNATYKNNITGIGVDSASGLTQLQSQSVNGGLQPVIGLGTSIAISNATNTSTFSADQSFEIWGDDSTATYFGTPYKFNGMNNRMTRVWKVQETGTIGTVTVAIPSSYVSGVTNPTLLVSNSSTFDGTATQVPLTITSVGPLSYATASVDFTSGQYFSFGAFVTAPGGVTGALAFWSTADNAGVLPGSVLTSWTDLSTNNTPVTVNPSGGSFTLQPGDAVHNFNPYTTGYSSTNYFYGNNTGVAANYNTNGNAFNYSPLTVFGAARPTSAANGLITGINNTTTDGIQPGFGINATYSRFYRYNNGINTSPTGANMQYTVNKSSVFMYQPPYSSTNTGTGNLVFGLDGNQNTVTGQNATSSLVGPYLHIGYDANSFGAFPGDIQEVVWYMDTLSAAKISRVQSYMAIKYGTTLATATATNYVNSSGNTIWTGSATYQHDVAGIGLDSASALVQKQSNSVNSGLQPVIGIGSSLAATNLTNANTFTTADQSYDVWGDDSASTYFGTPYKFGSTNYRITRIWKVQETGTIGTVTVAIPSGYVNGTTSPTLLVSNSSTFDGTATQVPMTFTTVGGVSYAVANIDFNNGQYFTFGAYVIGPGGVTAPITFWIKSDNAGVAAGSAMSFWKDLSTNNQAVYPNSGANFTLQAGDAAHNYNQWTTGYSSTNYFRGTNTLTAANYGTNGNVYTYSPLTVFGAARPTSAANGLITGIDYVSGSAVEPGFGINGTYPRMYGYFAGINTASNSVANMQLTVNKNSVFMYQPPYNSTHTGTGNLLFGLDGNQNIVTGQNASAAMAGPYLNVGYEGNSFGAFPGDIQEVVWYKDTLSAAKLSLVNSYFAIKYGITLGAGTATNYLNSAATVIWTGNATYQYNMAGIERDNASGLYQKQSNSVNLTPALGQVVMGVGTIAATNVLNTNPITKDSSALVWGDNNAAPTVTLQSSTANTFTFNGTSTNYKLARTWAVTATNFNQAVKVAVPVTLIGNPTLSSCNKLVMIQSTDPTFATGVSAAVLTAATVNSVSSYVVNQKFTNNATTYFTFAVAIEAPGGNVLLPAVTTPVGYTDVCKDNGWYYYYSDVAKTNRIFAINPNGNTFNNAKFTGTVTVLGSANIVTGSGNTSNLMPRLLTIVDSTGGSYSVGGGMKVRFFLDSTELIASLTAPATSKSWFKHTGTAVATMADQVAGGLNNSTLFTPSANSSQDAIDYVEFSGVTGFSTFGYISSTNSVVLPVSFASFTATGNGCAATLNWATATEGNSNYYEVEASTDGSTFAKVGSVKSNNSATGSSYSYVDNGLTSGINYFRLKAVDNDGKLTYSQIVTVITNCNSSSLSVSPNPTSNLVKVQGLLAGSKMQLFDANGKQLAELTATSTSETINISMYANGVYILRIQAANGSVSNVKVVKQ